MPAWKVIGREYASIAGSAFRLTAEHSVACVEVDVDPDIEYTAAGIHEKARQVMEQLHPELFEREEEEGEEEE